MTAGHTHRASGCGNVHRKAVKFGDITVKKQSKRAHPAKSKKKTTQAGTSDPLVQATAPDRRQFMGKAAWIGVGTVVLGGATFLGARSVRAKMAEFDLSRVGQGVPTVVQVHDPQCPTCTALQRQTRRALRGFEEDQLIYLVADIKTQQGQVFAGQFGVPHVTLLLFDGKGKLVETLRGMRQADELEPAFARLTQ